MKLHCLIKRYTTLVDEFWPHVHYGAKVKWSPKSRIKLHWGGGDKSDSLFYYSKTIRTVGMFKILNFPFNKYFRPRFSPKIFTRDCTQYFHPTLSHNMFTQHFHQMFSPNMFTQYFHPRFHPMFHSIVQYFRTRFTPDIAPNIFTQ